MTAISRTQDDPMAAVLSRAARGDEVAFEHIVATFHPDMRRVAYLVCEDAQLAEDAVAEAWAIAWRKLGSLRDPARLRPWLMSVAANEARQLIRRRRRRSIREVPIEDASGLGVSEMARDLDLDLAAVLGRLSPDDRAL